MDGQDEVERAKTTIMARVQGAGEKGIWDMDLWDSLHFKIPVIYKAIVELVEAGLIIRWFQNQVMDSGKEITGIVYKEAPPGYQPPPKPREPPNPRRNVFDDSPPPAAIPVLRCIKRARGEGISAAGLREATGLDDGAIAAAIEYLTLTGTIFHRKRRVKGEHGETIKTKVYFEATGKYHTRMMDPEDADSITGYGYDESEIPEYPVDATPRCEVGLGMHFQRRFEGGIAADDLDLLIDVINDAGLDSSLDGPPFYFYGLFHGNSIPDHVDDLGAWLDAAAAHLERWIDGGYDFGAVADKAVAFRFLQSLVRAGDQDASRVLKARIDAALDPARGTPDDRIDVIESCRALLTRRQVYDLLGDDGRASILHRHHGMVVRDLAARLLVPLRPRDPGDGFVPPGLAALAPGEQELLRFMAEKGVDISADGQFIAAGSGGKVHLFNRTSSTPIWSYNNSIGAVLVAISADGQYLAAGDGRNCYFFNKTSATPLWSYDTSEDMQNVALSADGLDFVANSVDMAYFFDFKDTDKDDLSDGYEILVTRTDPNSSDSDEDLLSDGAEILVYHTDPKKTDTDGDGYSDGWEVNNGYDPLNTYSNPSTIVTLFFVFLITIISGAYLIKRKRTKNLRDSALSGSETRPNESKPKNTEGEMPRKGQSDKDIEILEPLSVSALSPAPLKPAEHTSPPPSLVPSENLAAEDLPLLSLGKDEADTRMDEADIVEAIKAHAGSPGDGGARWIQVGAAHVLLFTDGRGAALAFLFAQQVKLNSLIETYAGKLLRKVRTLVSGGTSLDPEGATRLYHSAFPLNDFRSYQAPTTMLDLLKARPDSNPEAGSSAEDAEIAEDMTTLRDRLSRRPWREGA
nr:hypothetical protein [Candidatus Sigynarchaeum springense]